VKSAFWVAAIGILYAYIGYPIGIWVISRLRPRPWKSAPVHPPVSIILAVHNGMPLLPAKLHHLLSLDYSALQEVIVVSDGSTDGTAEFLARQQHPLLRAITLPVHSGKAAALNAGMASAAGEILLFVDIRPVIAPGALRRLVANFADPRVGCVTGELTVLREGHDAASGAVGGLYWKYEQWIRSCESAFDSPVGVYGGFYAVRRELAVRQPDGIILDDMFQPLSIVRQGYRSVIDPGARVSDIWPKEAKQEFQRKVRTLAGNLQLFRLAPWVLTTENRLLFQLISHKVMRLIVPWLLIVLLGSALLLSAHSRVYAVIAALQLVGWLLALAGLVVRIPVLHRLTAPASALLVLNAAAAAGLYRFLTVRGPLWKIWTPTAVHGSGVKAVAEPEAELVSGTGHSKTA
jgi:cellulose synthase/poly-beta-1,6-N-acetylglucosamine synthase-like glycosyltransferase